jgi:AraC-like DNA-binding protein
MISAAAAAGLIEAIEAAGGDPDRVLRAVDLDRADVSDRHAFIPSAAYTLALDEAARVTGDDCFGLHFGEQYHPKDIGALVYVLLHSPTVAAGFRNVARYLHVHNQAASVSFVRTEQRAYLQHRLGVAPLQRRRQHEELVLTVGLATLRLMAGSDWCPREVRFEHAAPPRTTEHQRVFGAPVLFGCDGNVMVVEPEFCDRDVPSADRRLYPVLEQYLERQLEGPTDNRFIVSVRTAVEDAMREGEPRLTDVAKNIGASARTLQRRLAESGVDYKALVDDIRHRQALRYLRDRNHTLTDVAYLLGYSEISAFSRAFRRWTGSTPSDYRGRLRGHP